MLRVIIVGNGDGWLDAPDIGYDYEVWGITNLALWKEVDLSIDMNVYEDLRWGEHKKLLNAKTVKKCEQCEIPYIELENYPLDEIIEKFDTDYFNSTVDYAIALALYQDYKEIELYGVTLDPSSEYIKLQPGVNFWCGVAKGRGVKLTVHGKNSTVMKTTDGLLYGYDRPQREKWEF